MTPEERKRRQSLWYQQEITTPLRVSPLPQAPEVKVEPTQPQRFKVTVSPTVQATPVQVSGPYRPPQPQPQKENIAKTFFKEAIKTPQKFANIVVEGNRLAYLDLPKAIAAQVSGNKEAMANINKDINRRLAGPGVFGGGLPEGFTSLERGSKSFIQDPSKAKTMVGTGAELGSYAIGGPTVKGIYTGLKLGAKPAIKAATSYVAPQAVAGVLGGAGNVLAQRPDATAKEIATQATFGGVAGPVLGIGLGTAGYGISRFLGRTNIENLAKTSDTNQIKNTISRELGENTPTNLDEVAANVAKEKTPQGVTKALDKTSQVPQTQPAGATQPITPTVAPLNDDLVTGVAQSNDVNEVKTVVDALLPNTDDATKNNIAINLTRVQDPVDVRRQLDEARLNEQRITETVTEAAPPREMPQTIEQAVTESQAPIAPQRLPEPTEQAPAEQMTTTAPEGVQGATAADNVPDSVDPLESLKAEARKYKSADEFIANYNGSATQYGNYNPQFREGGIAGAKRLNEVGIDPNKEITIYRGIDDPGGNIKDRKINDGDFVATDYDTALQYTGDPNNVVSMKVKAKDLLTDDPDNFSSEPFYIGSEYIYSSKQNAPKPLDKKQLTDIYNQATQPTPPVQKPTVNGGTKLQTAIDDYKREPLGSTNTSTMDRLVSESSTQEGKSFVSEQVSQIPKQKNGNIKVYRVGNLRDGNLSVTTDEGMAKVLAKERQSQGFDGTIYTAEVSPNNVKAVAPGIENELIVDGANLQPINGYKTIDDFAKDSPQGALYRGTTKGEKTQQAADNVPGATTPEPEQPGTVATDEDIILEASTSTPGKKQRKFVTSVKSADELSDDVRASISGEYTVKKNQALLDTAEVYSQNIDEATQNINKTLDSFTDGEVVDDQTVANAIVTATKLDSASDFDAATDIFSKLAEKLTEAGRAVQAAALLSRRTPEGLLFSATKFLKKSGKEITPEIKDMLQRNIDNIKQTAPGSIDRDFAVAQMQSDLMKFVPQNAIDNTAGVWKAGLLSGTKTYGGALMSNLTFEGLKRLSTPVSILADALMSVFTKKRTATGTQRGIFSGIKEGAEKGIKTLKTGIDLRRGGADKYEQFAEINFKNKTVQKVFGGPANLVFRGLSTVDQPTYYANLKNSLYDQAKAMGMNQGYKGRQLKSFMEQTVANPTDAMVRTAVKDAEKSVLSFDTVLGGVIPWLNRYINGLNYLAPNQKSAIKAVFTTVAPFTRVPSAFLSRTVDYTPVGPIKTAIGQIARKQFDQRALAQAIGEGVTGTGLIVLAYHLAQNDLISGEYPKNDTKAQSEWKAKGITANSVKIGDQWISLNYIGPLGLLFGAGKNLSDSVKNKENVPTQFINTVGGLGSGLLQQSFLQGLSGIITALNNPDRYLSNYVKGQAGSIVPAWINDIANASDSVARQTSNVGEAIMNRIPWLRQQLQPQYDVFGNPVAAVGGGGLGTFNPLKPSQARTSDVINELDRLKGVSNEYNVFPEPQSNKDFFGPKTEINKNQLNQINAELGPQINAAWNELIQTPEYLAASDERKAELLRAEKTDVVKKYKIDNDTKFGQTYTSSGKSYAGLDDNTVSVLKRVDRMNKEEKDAYFAGTPQAEYEYKLAKYELDKKSEGWDKIKDIKAQNSLAKSQVGKDFVKLTRDAYELSAADLTKFLRGNENAQDIAQSLMAYDQALINAGIRKTSKFKNGINIDGTLLVSGTGGTARLGYSRTGGRARTGGGGGATEGERIGISTLLSGVRPEQIQQPTLISPVAQKTRFKVKLPSSSKPRRIRLQ